MHRRRFRQRDQQDAREVRVAQTGSSCCTLSGMPLDCRDSPVVGQRRVQQQIVWPWELCPALRIRPGPGLRRGRTRETRRSLRAGRTQSSSNRAGPGRRGSSTLASTSADTLRFGPGIDPADGQPRRNSPRVLHVRGRIGRGQMDAVALPSQLDGRAAATSSSPRRLPMSGSRRGPSVRSVDELCQGGGRTAGARLARCQVKPSACRGAWPQRRGPDQIVRGQRQLRPGEFGQPCGNGSQYFLPALFHRLGYRIVRSRALKTAFTPDADCAHHGRQLATGTFCLG